MLKQLIRFVGIGGVNTLVTYILYLLLLFAFSYQVSYAITYIFGIGLSYWLNLKFVFKERNTKTKIVLYPLVYLVQYLFGVFILYLAIDRFEISEKIAPILVIIASIPLTFSLSKKILTRN